MTTRIPLAYQYDIALSPADAQRLARGTRNGVYKFTADEREYIVDSTSLPASFVHRVSGYNNLDMRDLAKVNELVRSMRAAGFTSAKPFSQVVGR